MGSITLSGVRKSFGELETIKGVDLEIEDREFVVFVGPSGSGKSTLLRLVAGLETLSDGAVQIDGSDVSHLRPSRRGLAMVFQSYALYPHMTVRGNMGFGLKMAGEPREQVSRKVQAAAKTLQLEQYLDRKPRALSGGQRQRVAIGRAIVRDPKAFLFDEPLSNLDAALRVQMRLEIARLHQSLNVTMIYVTHDQVEAMTLADKIVVLNLGRAEQVGSPLELYHRPRNRFIAEFIGSPKMNVVPCSGKAEGDGAVEVDLNGSGTVAIPGSMVSGADRPTALGIRPEHIAAVEPGQGHCSGSVSVAEHLGGDTFLYVDVENLGTITVRQSGLDPHQVGDQVGLSFDVANAHLFSDNGDALFDYVQRFDSRQ